MSDSNTIHMAEFSEEIEFIGDSLQTATQDCSETSVCLEGTKLSKKQKLQQDLLKLPASEQERGKPIEGLGLHLLMEMGWSPTSPKIGKTNAKVVPVVEFSNRIRGLGYTNDLSTKQHPTS